MINQFTSTDPSTKADANSIIDALAELEVQVKRLREETKTEMSKIVATMFKTFFDTFPEIKTIHWQQYTPLWNDGETCEFRLGSIEFNRVEYNTNEGAEEGCEFDIGDGFAVSKYSNTKGLEYELYRSCVAIENVIENMADEFESILGNNLTVYVTRNGIDIEDYDPEY
jgi:hypothetical protein